MNQSQKGFTLIELMIVITIIGILSVLAISVYGIYTKRTHVSEGLILSEGARVSVVDFYNAKSRWPADNTEAGIALPTDFAASAVKSITVDGTNEEITVVYTPAVSDDDTIIYELNATEGSTEWDCTAGTLSNLYRPSSCK